MKSINIKTSASKMSINRALEVDLSERQPCWYAHLKNKSPRSKAKWIVGIKNPNKDNSKEYSFMVSKAGDITDNKFWSYISSIDFGIELVDIYKNGGKTAVVNWVKNGCI